jgi:hypothetical protein
MRSGRWRMIVVALLAVVIVVGGLAWWMAGEQPDQYGTIGRQVNGMRADHFDAFWACALPRMRLDDLRSDQDLRYNINKRAASAPGRYASHVREQCLVKLNEHDRPLRALIAPEDLQGQIEELGRALTALRDGWGGYLTELDRVGGTPYDEEAMGPQLNKIAKGWFDYKVAHNNINRIIRERRGQP